MRQRPTTCLPAADPHTPDPTPSLHLNHPSRVSVSRMEAVEAGIVAAVGGGELTVDRVRAEVRALSEGIAAKQVSQSVSHVSCGIRTFPFSPTPLP